MYVYFAVDCYTYDLLHLDIYPYNTKQSGQAFLLALRAKGYQPRVIVNDMRVDYGQLVQQVFPKAIHHECIFHALQELHKHVKKIYGTEDAHSQWPRLSNAIESCLIPTTNNTTEQVIRIFTQHYKTFCGFENIDSARCYLAVFEKVYRFSPFSADAQERIRGKCPLELAGYQVKKLPMSQLFRGMALQWPASAFQELVPNV
jgi:transposase-like protein